MGEEWGGVGSDSKSQETTPGEGPPSPGAPSLRASRPLVPCLFAKACPRGVDISLGCRPTTCQVQAQTRPPWTRTRWFPSTSLRGGLTTQMCPEEGRPVAVEGQGADHRLFATVSRALGPLPSSLGGFCPLTHSTEDHWAPDGAKGGRGTPSTGHVHLL